MPDNDRRSDFPRGPLTALAAVLLDLRAARKAESPSAPQAGLAPAPRQGGARQRQARKPTVRRRL